ncbi:MAG: glycosyltransferase [Muribaculaceae bacterium]|nr:glycosyltransferase [Muribaculaceae bacterium]
MSTLSVIVPARNAEAYLDACMSSILSDLHEGDKLVIVDDGSSDSTRDIACRIATSFPGHVTVVDGHGRGVSAARNLGLAISSGDYVAFCDADDTYLPGALSQMRAILDKDATLDIVIGGFRRDYPEGCRIEAVETFSAEEAIANTLYQRPGWHESAWAKMYRRTILNTVSPLFIEGRRYEDLEATPRIYLAAKQIAFTASPVYWYRDNDSSFLAAWSPARADALWATAEVERTITLHCPTLLPAARCRRLSAAFNILALSSAAGADAIARQSWDIIKALRHSVVCDRRARLRNIVAAALSYTGSTPTRLLSRLHEYYKNL